MPGETEVIEYQTIEIGVAYLVKAFCSSWAWRPPMNRS